MLKRIKFEITAFVFLVVTAMLLGQLDGLLTLSLFARTILSLVIVLVSFAGGYFVVYRGGSKRIIHSVRN